MRLILTEAATEAAASAHLHTLAAAVPDSSILLWRWVRGSTPAWGCDAGDVILLDGVQLGAAMVSCISACRTHCPSVPIIAWCGDDALTSLAALEAGADEVLRDDVVARVALPALVRQAVARRRRERAAVDEVSATAQRFTSLFEQGPGAHVVLTPDRYDVVAVSDEYLRLTLLRRDELLGQPLLASFPSTPDDLEADGVRELRQSLRRVTSVGQPDSMGVQRYPVRREAALEGGFEHRLWATLNTPVHDGAGRVSHIVHRVEDVTELMVGSGDRLIPAEADLPTSLSVQKLQLDLVRRSRELHEANRLLAESHALQQVARRIGRFGAWRVDLPSGRITWSDEVCQIHEVEPGYDPTFEAAIGFYAPEYREVIAEHVERCRRDGVPFDVELQILTSRGRRIWVRAIGEAVRDTSGVVTRLEGALQDLTESVLERLSAEQTRQNRATTLESISDAFFTLDDAGRFTYVNGEAVRLLKRSRHELMDRVISEAFPEVIGSQFETEYKAILKSGQARTFEAFYHPVASWFEVHAYPSARSGVAVYFRDVTERRKSTEQLRLLQTSIERLNDIVMICEGTPIDEPGPRIVYVNEAFERRTGYTRAEAIGRTPRMLQGPMSDRRVLSAIRESLEARRPIRTEVQNLTKAGEAFWLEIDIAPVLDNEGQCTHWVAVERDVTERRDDETRLRMQAELLDQTQDAILVWELTGEVRFWNSGAEQLYGWLRSEAVGRVVSELTQRGDGGLDAALAQLLDAGRWEGELVQYSQAGRRMIVAGRWTLLRGATGAPDAVLAVHTDITQRKGLEEQLARAQRMESLGTMAGGMARDLNNALAPIVMSIGTLRASVRDAVSRELVETISESAQRGADIVSQVLSIARGVEGQRVALRPDLLVGRIEKLIRDTFPRNIALEVRIPAGVDAVLGDAAHLHEALRSVCLNARDAMSRGGRLRISVHNEVVDSQYAAMNLEAREGAYVQFDIEDDGEGIAPELMGRIFDPFFTTKEIGKGSGLGLPTTRALVQSHGGFVRVQSTQGSGTRISLAIPASPSVGSGGTPNVGSALPRGNGELVLVADDEPIIREVTRQTLEAFGYRVLLAANGAEAVSIFARRTDEIDIVVLDMVMPVMDGTVAMQVMRRLRPNIRVLGASGMSSGTGWRSLAGGSSGVDRFLSKPYTAETLLRAIGQLLRS